MTAKDSLYNVVKPHIGFLMGCQKLVKFSLSTPWKSQRKWQVFREKYRKLCDLYWCR